VCAPSQSEAVSALRRQIGVQFLTMILTFVFIKVMEPGITLRPGAAQLLERNR